MGGARILIVGGGIAGLATAYHLARRGERGVVLLERDAALAQRSSAQSAAILRTSGGSPAVGTLARESAAFLRRPPPGFGDGGPLVDDRGLVLCAGPAGAAALAREAAPAVAAGGVRALEPGELGRLVPDLRTPHGRDVAAWLFADGGRIDVDRLVGALAAAARAGGVELVLGARVAELELREGRASGVRLADGARLAAERVVLAAGAWAGALGSAAGSRVDLRPTRRHLLVALGSAPARSGAPIVWDVERGFYARPERGGWLLCACDRDDVADPDRLAADPAVLAALREKASLYLDLARDGREEAWAGLRTLTADGSFAIGPDPDVDHLFWVAGFGGAGMGAGIGAGRLAAALLAGAGDALATAVAPGRLRRNLR